MVLTSYSRGLELGSLLVETRSLSPQSAGESQQNRAQNEKTACGDLVKVDGAGATKFVNIGWACVGRSLAPPRRDAPQFCLH